MTGFDPARQPVVVFPGRKGEKRCYIHGWLVEMFKWSGWIWPTMPLEHPAARRHGGRIYLNRKDVKRGVVLVPGTLVEFYLYEDEKGLGAECCTWCAHPRWQPRDLFFHRTVQSSMIYHQQLMKIRASLGNSWGSDFRRATSGSKYVMDYYSVDLTTLEDANKNESAGDGSSTALSTDCPSTTLSPSIPTVFPVASLLHANATYTGRMSMTDANVGENSWSDSEDSQTEADLHFPSKAMSAGAILDIGPPPGLPIPPALQARFGAWGQA